MTNVYMLDRGEDILSPDLLEKLPPWRRERTEKLRNPAAGRESLAAGLLWTLAMVRWGIDPAEPVTVLPAGKPVFASRRDIWFSLSHSGQYAMCAVSTEPVGADVQQMRQVKLTIARRLHPGERAWLESVDPARQNGEFFRLWARKEAWVKAVSKGQMLSLSQTDVTADPPGWRFEDYTLSGDHRAAVCLREGEAVSPLTVLTTEELLHELREIT